jgi:pSer/pThr/pTyr-binding forkhead associated (FHA) protein
MRTQRTEKYSRTQSFTCSSELLRAFESRAFELGCTFDWLLEEAMQRLLAEAREAQTMPPPESVHQMKPRSVSQTMPLPLPPDALPSTVPPPPTRQQLRTVTPPLPPPPAQRSRTAVAVNEPLVLDYGGERLVIDWQPYVIGRSPSVADLVIEDSAVSRRHAVIEHLADGWVITDLGSTNGILVDGQVVRHSRLEPGMVMSIGPMTFGVRTF